MKIKNHEILNEINRGAVTTVYKARHLNLNRPVLLKVLNQQWLKEGDLLKRFQREAQISAHLQHPNIVNVYDFEISPDLVFISLEFVEGKTLGQFIRETTPVPLENVISVLKNLLKALEYAHQKGVVHRDLKPDNILIDNNFNARITDFGLATFKDIPAVTEQGQSVGTPAYMSPEQIQGKPGDIQSDLYSLGITLYEMLTSESPFLKENTAATLQSVLTDKIKDISTFRNDIPEWLETIVYELTSRQPDERPKSATAVLEKLYKETGEQIQETKKDKKGKGILYFSAALVISLLVLFYFFLPEPENQIDDEIVAKTIPNPVSLKNKINEPEGENAVIHDQSKQKSSLEVDSLKVKKEDVKQPVNHSATQKNKPEMTKSAKGSFYIMCSPWAKIILDGDSVDVTPMKQAIIASTGKHFVELINPNYKTEKREIEIVANKNDTLNIRLKPNFGYLFVKASPWAKLFINDEYKEDTPLTEALIIPAGRNILKLKNPSFETITDTIFIEAGKTVEKQFTFAN